MRRTLLSSVCIALLTLASCSDDNVDNTANLEVTMDAGDDSSNADQVDSDGDDSVDVIDDGAGDDLDAGDALDTPEDTPQDAPPDIAADVEEEDAQDDDGTDYSDLQHWLCHPDRDDDPCDVNLDVTHVAADGSINVEAHVVAAEPAFDCFYIYPTCSTDGGLNSDLSPGGEEAYFVQNQAARLSSVCRVFAPVYRQVTVAGLFGGRAAEGFVLAYSDVEDAFAHYMENENEGRGVVLIGHSQGARMLTQLVRDEVDRVDEVRERLISAYLIGSSVLVPPGEDVDGVFQNTPLCRTPEQTGCVVTYASYRDTAPPSFTALFGNGHEGLRAGCNQPGGLMGQVATHSPVFPTVVPQAASLYLQGQSSPWADPASNPAIETPFYAMTDFVETRCVASAGLNNDYLSVRVLADPEDPRVDSMGGDLFEGWGVHLIDIHITTLAMLELIERQAEAWSTGE